MKGFTRSLRSEDIASSFTERICVEHNGTWSLQTDNGERTYERKWFLVRSFHSMSAHCKHVVFLVHESPLQELGQNPKSKERSQKKAAGRGGGGGEAPCRFRVLNACFADGRTGNTLTKQSLHKASNALNSPKSPIPKIPAPLTSHTPIPFAENNSSIVLPSLPINDAKWWRNPVSRYFGLLSG